MKNEERMNFECEHCGTLFDRHLFDIPKSLERVDYLGPIPSVEVERDESVANFCSTGCRNKKRQTTMQQQGVPIRRIGVGPIEPYARCGAPVDMTKFHVTFTENDFRIPDSRVFELVHVDYLAVLCKDWGNAKPAYCKD